MPHHHWHRCAVALMAAATGGASACPCANASLCAPLTTPPPDRETLVFYLGASPWQSFDWRAITTVAVYLPVESALLCAAHAAGVRVVAVVEYDGALADGAAVLAWAAATAGAMNASFTDGINLDIEGVTTGAALLTDATAAAVAAVRAVNPAAQVSFDTSIYPTSAYVAGGYDLRALAELLDFVVPMAYDMGWAASPARANSPLPLVAAGVDGYTRGLGIPPSKVVLALPWYGYTFPCDAYYPLGWSGPGAPPCRSTGFSGSWSVTYEHAVRALLPRAPAGLQTDAASSSVWLDYNDTAGAWHQAWLDDAATLAAKYAVAVGAGLRGVAVWAADFAGNGSDAVGAPLWAALRAGVSAAPASATGTATASVTPTGTAVPTPPGSPSVTGSASSSRAATRSRSVSRTAAVSASASASASPSGSASPAAPPSTPSPTPTRRSATRTPSRTPSQPRTPPRSPTPSRSHTRTGTSSPSSTRSRAATRTGSRTPRGTRSGSRTATASRKAKQ